MLTLLTNEQHKKIATEVGIFGYKSEDGESSISGAL
jgi:hypothetical protein